MSNFGVVETSPPNSPIKQIELYCTLPSGIRNIILCMVTVNGALQFSFTYNESAIPSQLVHELSDSVMEKIQELVSTPL